MPNSKRGSGRSTPPNDGTPKNNDRSPNDKTPTNSDRPPNDKTNESMEDDADVTLVNDDEWEDLPDDEEENGLKIVEPDMEFENRLDKMAGKHKMSAKNVKSLIHHVLTDNDVVDLMKNKLKELSGEKTPEKLPYEPKLTRSKLKEISEAQPWSLAPWPLSPAKKTTQQSVTLLEAQFSDEEDDEYDPTKSQEEEVSDDDSESVVSSSRCSDLGSPMPNSPRTPITPMTPLTPTPSTSYANLGTTPTLKSPMGPPTNKASIKPLFKKRLHLEDSETIALRTRSKLPLVDTPLDVIESSFVAPDFTPEMYDIDDYDMDEDYVDFLQKLVKDPNQNSTDTQDDETNDPEYNFLAEEEVADKDEMRHDKSVKVSKRELNELLDGLCELFGSDDEDLKPFPPYAETRPLKSRTPPNAAASKPPIGSKPGKSPGKRSSTNTANAPPQKVAKTAKNFWTDDRGGKPSGKGKDSNIDQNQNRTGKGKNLSSEQNQDCISGKGKHIEQNETEFPTIKQEHYSLGEIMDNEGISAEDSETQDSENTNVDSTVTLPLMSPEQYAQLQDQLRKHTQLLFQICILADAESGQYKNREQCANYLYELDHLKNISPLGDYSVYNIPNLPISLSVMQNFDDTYPEEYEKLKNWRIANRIKHHKKGYHWANVLTKPQMLWFYKCPGLLYPELMPMCKLRTPSQYRSVMKQKCKFIEPEDALIALGLSELSEMKLTQGQKAELLVDMVLPAKNCHQIKNRICSIRMYPKVDNPFSVYDRKGVLPQEREISPFDPWKLPSDLPHYELPPWCTVLRDKLARTHQPRKRKKNVEPTPVVKEPSVYQLLKEKRSMMAALGCDMDQAAQSWAPQIIAVYTATEENNGKKRKRSGEDDDDGGESRGDQSTDLPDITHEPQSRHSAKRSRNDNLTDSVAGTSYGDSMQSEGHSMYHDHHFVEPYLPHNESMVSLPSTVHGSPPSVSVLSDTMNFTQSLQENSPERQPNVTDFEASSVQPVSISQSVLTKFTGLGCDINSPIPEPSPRYEPPKYDSPLKEPTKYESKSPGVQFANQEPDSPSGELPNEEPDSPSGETENYAANPDSPEPLPSLRSVMQCTEIPTSPDDEKDIKPTKSKTPEKDTKKLRTPPNRTPKGRRTNRGASNRPERSTTPEVSSSAPTPLRTPPQILSPRHGPPSAEVASPDSSTSPKCVFLEDVEVPTVTVKDDTIEGVVVSIGSKIDTSETDHLDCTVQQIVSSTGIRESGDSSSSHGPMEVYASTSGANSSPSGFRSSTSGRGSISGSRDSPVKRELSSPRKGLPKSLHFEAHVSPTKRAADRILSRKKKQKKIPQSRLRSTTNTQTDSSPQSKSRSRRNSLEENPPEKETSSGKKKTENKPPVQDIKEDTESHLAELMTASTTIEAPPKRRANLTKQEKRERQKQAYNAILTPNILENDPLKDERVMACTIDYLERVQKALESEPDKFQTIVRALATINTADITQLYKEICINLKDYPQLVTDFALFLTPEQAVQCGCYQDYEVFRKSKLFIRTLELYFQKMPSQLHKLRKALSADQSQEEIHEQLKNLLKNQPLLLNDLSQFMDNEPPPETHMEDFEEVYMLGNSSDSMTNSPTDAAATDSCEDAHMPDEEENHATKKCMCSCHEAVKKGDREKRKTHCRNCALKVKDNRLYYVGQKRCSSQVVTVVRHDKTTGKAIAPVVAPVEERKVEVSPMAEKRPKRKKREKRKKQVTTPSPGVAPESTTPPISDSEARPISDSEARPISDTEARPISDNDSMTEASDTNENPDTKPLGGVTDSDSCHSNDGIHEIGSHHSNQGPVTAFDEKNIKRLVDLNFSKAFDEEQENQLREISSPTAHASYTEPEVESIHDSDLDDNESPEIDKNSRSTTPPLPHPNETSSEASLPVNRPWAMDEDKLVLESLQGLTDVSAHTFQQIARQLHCRTAEAVETRFNMLMELLAGDSGSDVSSDEE